ncbi:hypothetical protein GH714_018973 [Hevea brasiliensis]|uniref:Uncharacterized protein n=1 Tax=Hevea brasiliensis TaxID=3981 RepID=A0A6A6MCK3_HEVBR|nr:hypothetical protein GH714_018973 [Hevea brasiliensis]
MWFMTGVHNLSISHQKCIILYGELAKYPTYKSLIYACVGSKRLSGVACVACNMRMWITSSSNVWLPLEDDMARNDLIFNDKPMDDIHVLSLASNVLNDYRAAQQLEMQTWSCAMCSLAMSFDACL